MEHISCVPLVSYRQFFVTPGLFLDYFSDLFLKSVSRNIVVKGLLRRTSVGELRSAQLRIGNVFQDPQDFIVDAGNRVWGLGSPIRVNDISGDELEIPVTLWLGAAQPIERIAAFQIVVLDGYPAPRCPRQLRIGSLRRLEYLGAQARTQRRSAETRNRIAQNTHNLFRDLAIDRSLDIFALGRDCLDCHSWFTLPVE